MGKARCPLCGHKVRRHMTERWHPSEDWICKVRGCRCIASREALEDRNRIYPRELPEYLRRKRADA